MSGEVMGALQDIVNSKVYVLQKDKNWNTACQYVLFNRIKQQMLHHNGLTAATPAGQNQWHYRCL